MNKTLTALMTKIQWQLTGIQQQMQQVNQQITDLDSQLDETQLRITSASVAPRVIVPEREIAGMHFIMGQQQIQDELSASKSELLAQQAQLTTKKLRLETELKMLEKHQNNQLEQQRKQALLTEQNNMDEWIVQRRTIA